ncbi:MAG: hypothetical protein ACOC55_01200 [Candidatus Natronoplasma sp.]
MKMSELDETINTLEWDKRLDEVRYGRVKDEEKEKYLLESYTLEILIAFFGGLMFGLIIGTIVIPTLAGIL